MRAIAGAALAGILALSPAHGANLPLCGSVRAGDSLECRMPRTDADFEALAREIEASRRAADEANRRVTCPWKECR